MPKGLYKYTREQLEEEIERREQANRLANKPKELAEKDWSSVINSCNEQIDHLMKEGRGVKDICCWVYEAAMIAVFGENIWDWINELDDG